MRVTQSMLNRQMLQNLQSNNERMDKYQDMLSSGKRINKPADDPIGVSYSMRYEAQLNRNTQYLRNLDAARSSIDITESVVSKVNDVLQRSKELAVQGSNGTVPLEAKQSIATEIDQLTEELVQLGNSKFNGKYIFNGQMTDKPPYTLANADTQNTDNRDIVLTIADGTNMITNTSGDKVFGKGVDAAGNPQEPDNVFAILKKLSTALKANDGVTTGQTVALIETRLDKIQSAWADIGARSNRIDLVENRLKDAEVNLSELKSKVEDADMAEVITQLKMAENVQRSSLATGARVLQPSLVDFLR